MDKQVFAKVGVFVLLGLNVGAYYLFWPASQNAPRNAAKGEEKGAVALLPKEGDMPTPAKPKEFPVGSLDNVGVLPPPTLPKAAKQELRPDEAVNRLLDHIKKEADAGTVVIPPPPIDIIDPAAKHPLRDETKPKVLPPLMAEPLVKDPNIGVTSALTPKLPSLWTFRVESSKPGKMQIIATLSSAKQEFHIYCEKIGEKREGVEFEAVDVFLDGPTVGIRCKRLTIPIGDPARIVFEGNVLVDPGSPFGSSMRTSRLVWELPAPPSAPMPVLGPPR